ncbi:sugar 3,4-ketoisomerase [Telluribacter humicola]|uniref:sugar 3,4-ketoisomerase n=1 Tax=Telluribacter humicola TaxID=1720261 RepID=UPI001A96ABBF|nr:FdtA/QdtA family cupin domain-containing protein [Telluribacter humicola]
MPKCIKLDTYPADSGNLTVFENIIPGPIRRVFYIYGAGHIPRGGHRHKTTWNALICLQGHCKVYVNNGQEESNYLLDTPSTCLILEPQDWHTMEAFSQEAILLVLSNQYYDKSDYIYEPYPSTTSKAFFD